MYGLKEEEEEERSYLFLPSLEKADSPPRHHCEGSGLHIIKDEVSLPINFEPCDSNYS